MCFVESSNTICHLNGDAGAGYVKYLLSNECPPLLHHSSLVSEIPAQVFTSNCYDPTDAEWHDIEEIILAANMATRVYLEDKSSVSVSPHMEDFPPSVSDSLHVQGSTTLQSQESLELTPPSANGDANCTCPLIITSQLQDGNQSQLSVPDFVKSPHDLLKPISHMNSTQKLKLYRSIDWVFIFDSEGQPAFNNIMPLFFPTLNMKLSESLDDRFSYYSGWLLQCTQPEHFFTPRLLQVLNLRVSALHHTDSSIREQSAIDSQYKVWKNGVYWSQSSGAEGLLESTSRQNWAGLSLTECVEESGKLGVPKHVLNTALFHFTIVHSYPDILPKVMFVELPVFLEKLTELGNVQFSYELCGDTSPYKSRFEMWLNERRVIIVEQLHEIRCSHYVESAYAFLKQLEHIASIEYLMPCIMQTMGPEKVSTHHAFLSSSTAPLAIQFSGVLAPRGLKGDVEEYAKTILSGENWTEFLSYLSIHPHIQSIMYVPLHSAIVMAVYLQLPKIRTQLYFCSLVVSLSPDSKLPQMLRKSASDPPQCVSRNCLAISQPSNLPSSITVIDAYSHFEVHLFLPESCSYNYLHLSIQELLAACHISLQSHQEQEQLLLRSREEDHLRNMMRFVAGLTKFEGIRKEAVKLIGAFYDVASELSPSGLNTVLSFTYHGFLTFLFARCAKIAAIELKNVLGKVIGIFYKHLLTDLPELDALCQSLKEHGQILHLWCIKFIPKSWIVLYRKSLITQVNDTIFAPEHFTKHYSALASSTGVVEQSILTAHFPDLHPDIIAQLVTFVEFGRKIFNPETLRHLPANKAVLSKPHFVSAVVCINIPDGICEPRGKLDCDSWLMQCMQPMHFFTTRLLQSLIVQVLALHHTDSSIREQRAIHSQCKVWKNGVHWSQPERLTVLIRSLHGHTMAAHVGEDCLCDFDSYGNGILLAHFVNRFSRLSKLSPISEFKRTLELLVEQSTISCEDLRRHFDECSIFTGRNFLVRHICKHLIQVKTCMSALSHSTLSLSIL